MAKKLDIIKRAKKMPNNKTPCTYCNCRTESIRKGRTSYKCSKCGKNKSLSDFYFYEATHKIKSKGDD